MIRALSTIARHCCRWTLPALLAVVDRLAADGMTEPQMGQQRGGAS